MGELRVHRPESLEEASRLLRELGDGARVLAGGTDIVPGMKLGKLRPAHLVSLGRVPGLDGVAFDGRTLKMGARCTLNDLMADDKVSGNLPMLCKVLGTIASHQVRNRATLGGNICNAAPSADSAPLLICLGARVGIYSADGEREVPLEGFFKGPGATDLQPGELVTHILVDRPPEGTRCAYVKHKIRESLEIAITGVAVALTLAPDGTCDDARVVVGACAPVPIRVPEAEDVLKGTKLETDNIRKAGEAAAERISPIDDVRGSAAYRRGMTAVSLERAVAGALKGVER